MEILLSRDSFRESVFNRDKHKCVICKDPAQDAHHILDRKLFEDGGYYLNNGASLCGPCHIKAETGVITCSEIREAAGIKVVVLPPGFDPNLDYDKWGESDDDLLSRKYGRTYHYPFSPGTTSDDRINHVFISHLQRIKKVVHTEKLDGENTCISKLGVFARSHAAPTIHKWADYLKIKWSILKHDLGDLEVFGENCYAIHSIKYVNMRDHFFVFGIRVKDTWLSWEETKFYAELMDLQMVPEIKYVSPYNQSTMWFKGYEEDILEITKQPSVFKSYDNQDFQKEPRIITPCTMEGIVTRNVEEYKVRDFKTNVFKYVRKGHVTTDEHWSRNPKRATLAFERGGKDFIFDKDKNILK